MRRRNQLWRSSRRGQPNPILHQVPWPRCYQCQQPLHPWCSVHLRSQLQQKVHGWCLILQSNISSDWSQHDFKHKLTRPTACGSLMLNRPKSCLVHWISLYSKICSVCLALDSHTSSFMCLPRAALTTNYDFKKKNSITWIFRVNYVASNP